MRNYKVRAESLDFVTFRSKIGGYAGRWLGIPNCSDWSEKWFLHTLVLSLGTSEDPNQFGSRRFPLEYSPLAGKPWVSRCSNLNTLQQAKLDFGPQKCKNIITRTTEGVRCSSSQDSKYPWVLQVCTIKAPNWVKFITLPLTSLPTIYFSSIASHGSSWICLWPKLNFLSSVCHYGCPRVGRAECAKRLEFARPPAIGRVRSLAVS